MKKFTINYGKAVCAAFILLLTSLNSFAQTWSDVGVGFNNNVYGMLTDTGNNVLYVAGAFTASGPTTLNHVTQWDGSAFSPMNIGMNNFAYAFVMFNNELYVAGAFTIAGSNACNYIARWDGSDWQPVGSGMDNQVYYLIEYNGELYAGGIFTTAGGVPASRIAKWNGSAWSALGSGVTSAGSLDISALEVYNGELYAGGKFTDAGGVAVNNIARWNGTTWSDAGGGITGPAPEVNDFMVYNNELYTAGIFTNAGGVAASGIAKWNGTTWSATGTGLTGLISRGSVLAVYKGELYVGGNFNTVDGFSANRVARYNGTSWQDLGAGCDQQVDAFEVYNDELYVGGAFFQAGGVGRVRIAKWHVPCTVTAAASGTDVTCFGSCDGTASVFYAGVPPFTYLWSNGDTLDTLSGLCPGNYSVTVTDNNGCTATDSVTVIEYPLPATSMTGTNPVCNAECNGSAVVSATGRAPFTYSWSTLPVQTSDTATALCAGTYYVTVTDSAGCISVDSITIVDPAAATLSFTTNATACPGVCDGSATANTTSPDGPYTYVWNSAPVQNTQTAINLCAGTYIVTVTDSLGCSATDSITVTESPAFTLTFASAPPTCPGSCNGIASVTTASPFAPYTYSWNTFPVQNTDTATALCEGTYSVLVTDTMGCISSDSITVTDPVAATLSFITTSTACPGACDGTATVNTTSPDGPYTYVWNSAPVQNTQTAINLCAGTYTVTVTDSLGCSVTDSITVTESPAFTLTFASASPTCPGSCNGIASVITTSPFAPYTYSWNTLPVQNTDTATALCAGIYSVLVTDTMGCASLGSIAITDPATALTVTPINATCPGGGCDGSATAVSSGPSPYTYLWSTNDTTNNISNLCPGTYLVTVTDSLGCALTDSVTITVPANPSLTFTSVNPLCFGDCTGLIVPIASGNSALTYSWSTGDTTTSIDSLCEGWYSLTVTDSLGCSSNDSLFISQPPQIDILVQMVTVSCNGFCDGFINAFVSGGTPSYSYLWSTGDTIPDLFNVCAGSYTITVTDTNGCIHSTIATMTQPDSLLLTMIPTDATCFGCNDGSIAVNVTGGTFPYSYFWTPPVPNPNQLTAGIYYLCVFDSNNCQVCDSAIVDQPNGVFEINGNNQQLYVIPNPFNTSALIKIPAGLIKSNQLYFSVYDLLGNKVNKTTYSFVKNNNEYVIKIERDQLSSGMYIFRVSDGNNPIGTGRFIVE